MRDARAEGYVAKYGRKAWELDALDPRVLRTLMEQSIADIRNEAQWSASLAEEVADLRQMEEIVDSLRGDD
jgi:hypothetical protein